MSAEATGGWTAGPWRAGQIEGDFGIYTDEGYGIGQVAFRRGTERIPNAEANARLIAAAPTLAAFVGVIARLTKDGEDVDGEPFDMPSDDAVDTIARLVNDARALLARVGGEGR